MQAAYIFYLFRSLSLSLSLVWLQPDYLSLAETNSDPCFFFSKGASRHRYVRVFTVCIQVYDIPYEKSEFVDSIL